MRRYRSEINSIYFVALLLLPVVLWSLPADAFDSGQSLCLSVVILDQTCPACGMTRAVQHLLHFDFSAAASFNKLVFLVLPILILVWFLELRKSFKYIRRKREAV